MTTDCQNKLIDCHTHYVEETASNYKAIRKTLIKDEIKIQNYLLGGNYFHGDYKDCKKTFGIDGECHGTKYGKQERMYDEWNQDYEKDLAKHITKVLTWKDFSQILKDENLLEKLKDEGLLSKLKWYDASELLKDRDYLEKLSKDLSEIFGDLKVVDDNLLTLEMILMDRDFLETFTNGNFLQELKNKGDFYKAYNFEYLLQKLEDNNLLETLKDQDILEKLQQDKNLPGKLRDYDFLKTLKDKDVLEKLQQDKDLLEKLKDDDFLEMLKNKDLQEKFEGKNLPEKLKNKDLLEELKDKIKDTISKSFEDYEKSSGDIDNIKNNFLDITDNILQHVQVEDSLL